MINSNFLVKSLAICAMTFMIILSSCGKDEDTLFKDCVLPWAELEEISQAELPKEIVDFTYKTFPEADTLLAVVFKYCSSGNRLMIQPEDTPNYDFLFYDSCGDLLAKGKSTQDDDIRSILRQSIKQELGNEALLYDSFIVNYENGNIEYISEVYFLGDSPRYLFDKDGKVLCKLF